MWTNLKNNKKYVGSSSNLRARFYQHFNVKYLISCSNMYFCIALLNHGYSNFRLEILEYCDIKDLALIENYYINLLEPEYNLLKIAYSRQGLNTLKKRACANILKK